MDFVEAEFNKIVAEVEEEVKSHEYAFMKGSVVLLANMTEKDKAGKAQKEAIDYAKSSKA